MPSQKEYKHQTIQTPQNLPSKTEEETELASLENQKTGPIFTSLFELFWFMILTETSKPLYFSIFPLTVIIIFKYVYKKAAMDEIHWKYFSSLCFLFYEYLVGNSVYALLRDLVTLVLVLIVWILLEKRLFGI
ncbi:hypothetical protein CDIK_3017 [Cucumispora dikerogammari]|nr:hypothetical protein CDIK_3017 [Cucumispora dikerogammari]